MTSRELLYVKTVADEQSISKAAKKLFVAQPSLSQSLKHIEDSLGTPLFQRAAGGMILTYAGERYYQAACQILKIYEDLETELSDYNNLKTGRIYGGITHHLGAILLPKILPEFKESCPFVEVYISEATTEKLEAAVLSGHSDFAILHAPQKESQPMLSREYLARDPFVIALAPGHPLIEKARSMEGYPYPVLDPQLLKNEPFLMLSKEQGIRHVTDSILAQAKVTPKIILTLRNYETIQHLAGKGVGVTLLPQDYARLTPMDCSPVLLSISKKYNPSWDLCITTLKEGFLSRADQYFLSLVRKYFSESTT